MLSISKHLGVNHLAQKMVFKQESLRGRSLRNFLFLLVPIFIIVVCGFHLVQIANLKTVDLLHTTQHITSTPPFKRLIFYNRPPKTGSTSVRIAMKKVLDEHNLIAAKCFNKIEWNEMALRTIVNRRNIDFYGCHTRLYRERFIDIVTLRGGNVTFMTSTREPSDIILSAYLQQNRDRDMAKISGAVEMQEEVKRYKQHVDNYPVNALYSFHGADQPLKQCPYEWAHVDAMRRLAERYEIVIDLHRPHESAALVQAVTGLKPDFTLRYNERTGETSPMIDMLMKVNTTHKSCGNELVHEILSQQFNIIKDRLMQNRCFGEESGTFELCDKSKLSAATISERTREESFREKSRLKGL